MNCRPDSSLLLTDIHEETLPRDGNKLVLRSYAEVWLAIRKSLLAIVANLLIASANDFSDRYRSKNLNDENSLIIPNHHYIRQVFRT